MALPSLASHRSTEVYEHNAKTERTFVLCVESKGVVTQDRESNILYIPAEDRVASSEASVSFHDVR